MTAKEKALDVLLRGGLAAILVVAWAVLAKAQQFTSHTLQHDGLTRTYRLFLPSDYAIGAAIPLVLNLHGRGSTGVEQALYTDMNAVADTAGFAVCYPDGVNREWNVGWSFGSGADDLGFLTRLIDTLQAGYGFDARRTYSCGMSNGGFMSYELSCERPERIAAIASVTGGMLPARRRRCNPGLPVPVLQIHGTADPIVRYGGTDGVNEAIEATVAGWVALNGCDAEPTVAAVPDRRDDGFTTERLVYGGCDGGAEVQLMRVDGGRHTWPGGAIEIDPAAGGGTTYDFSATAEIWGFFRRFARDGTSSATDPGSASEVLRVWPNPVRWGRLSLKPTTRDRTIEVWDARGQLVTSVSVPAGVGTLDIGRPAVGVYLLRERGAGGQAERLLVE